MSPLDQRLVYQCVQTGADIGTIADIVGELRTRNTVGDIPPFRDEDILIKYTATPQQSKIKYTPVTAHTIRGEHVALHQIMGLGSALLHSPGYLFRSSDEALSTVPEPDDLIWTDIASSAYVQDNMAIEHHLAIASTRRPPSRINIHILGTDERIVANDTLHTYLETRRSTAQPLAAFIDTYARAWRQARNEIYAQEAQRMIATVNPLDLFPSVAQRRNTKS